MTTKLNARECHEEVACFGDVFSLFVCRSWWQLHVDATFGLSQISRELLAKSTEVPFLFFLIFDSSPWASNSEKHLRDSVVIFLKGKKDSNIFKR